MATTLTLAEQNHAEELKRVAMEFACKQLAAVMATEGYQHMVTSCPQLQVCFCVVRHWPGCRFSVLLQGGSCNSLF